MAWQSSTRRRAAILGCTILSAMPAWSSALAQQTQVTTTYTYDALGRLVSAGNVTTNGSSTGYAYDAANNRTALTATPPAAPVAGTVTATVAGNSTNNNIPLNLSGGPAVSVAITTNVAHGSTSISGTTITYTPTPGYSGSDSFQYTATNISGTSAAATANITVTVLAPVANPVSTTVAYGSSSNPISLNITGGPATSVTVSTQAAHGTATASGTSITYTPTSGYFGGDTFNYTASNATGASAPAAVSITVNPQAPVAGAVSATVASNSSSDPITLNLSGGAATSVTVSSQALHGTATASGTSITYTPTSGYTGPDSFQYTATNAGGTSASATVTLTVSNGPTANNDSYTFTSGRQTMNVLANDTSPQGYTLTITSVTQPNGGELVTISNNQIVFSANGMIAPDSGTFTYTISDGHGGTATATVHFNWQCSGTCL